MNVATRVLLGKLRGGANSYNHANGDNVEVVTTVPVVTDKKLSNIQPGLFTPKSKAQIQFNIVSQFYSEAADVYTIVASGAVPAGLQQALPYFLFANIDLASGYAQLRAQYPLTAWAYNAPVVVGKDYPFAQWGQWDATVMNNLRNGDIVFPYTAISGGTNYMALVIVRASDVPYAALVQATNSATFDVGLLRNTVNVGQEAQFANRFLTSRGTEFGMFTTNPLNPEGYINPEQNRPNIVDIDLGFSVDRYNGLSSLRDHGVNSIRLNFFINQVRRTA